MRTLADMAEQRVGHARALGRLPTRWVASAAAIEQLWATAEPEAWGRDEEFLGLPLVLGTPRSEWGLDLLFDADAKARIEEAPATLAALAAALS